MAITFQPKQKRIILIGLLVLVVAALTTGAVVLINTREKDDVVVCSDERLNNVSGVLLTKDVEFLMPEAEAILKLPDYDKDPNCLNVVTTYYIHLSDYDKAKAHLDKLETVYDEDKGFSPALGTSAKSMDQLRSNVKFLEEQNNKIKDGTSGGIIPSTRVEQ